MNPWVKTRTTFIKDKQVTYQNRRSGHRGGCLDSSVPLPHIGRYSGGRRGTRPSLEEERRSRRVLVDSWCLSWSLGTTAGREGGIATWGFVSCRHQTRGSCWCERETKGRGSVECEVVRTVPGCCVTARGRGWGLCGRLDRGTPDEHGQESCHLSRNL